MSRAFVKEDVDPPERSGRVRSSSGLPPGAANYITSVGAERLRRELEGLRNGESGNADRIAEIERILASVTIVGPPDDPQSVAFGAKVTVRSAAEVTKSYRIVGVDELHLYVEAISWLSPIGKALLAAELGDRLMLEDEGKVELVQVEYPSA